MNWKKAGWLLQQLTPVLFPLAIAGVIAYLLDPVVDFLQKRGIPRTRAIVLVFFVGLMLVIGLLGTVVPRLVVEVGALVRSTPDYAKNLIERVEKMPFYKRFEPLWHPKDSTNAVASASATVSTNATNSTSTNRPPSVAGEASSSGQLLRDLTQVVGQKAATVLPEIGQWILDKLQKAAGLFGLVLGLALVPVYAFYFLMEKKGIQRSWTDYLPLRDDWAKKEVVFVISSVNDSLIVFFRGQVLVAMCSGALLTIGFLSMGLNYAVLLGVVAGILGIIPYMGVAMSIIPALILAAVQFGDWRVLLVPLIFGVVNALEGFVISPKIIGDRVGLHPLTIIVAVVTGTSLMGGILGGVLAIPLTAALRAILSRYVWHRPDRAEAPATTQPEARN